MDNPLLQLKEKGLQQNKVRKRASIREKGRRGKSQQK
jgi:hypothetical protein